MIEKSVVKMNKAYKLVVTCTNEQDCDLHTVISMGKQIVD
jgi:hypothetical protein